MNATSKIRAWLSADASPLTLTCALAVMAAAAVGCTLINWGAL